MIRAIKHRGPDETGYYRTESVQLGMARLSILDLTSEGLCPVVERDPGGRSGLVVQRRNLQLRRDREELKARGHLFRTRLRLGGTAENLPEVGPGLPRQVNGMFAFAIADFVNDMLFAARDRAGEKPLYYCENRTEFLRLRDQGPPDADPNPERN